MTILDTVAQLWLVFPESLPCLQQSWVQIVTSTIIALPGLYAINRTLIRWISNRRKSHPWNVRNELVVVTGGCSGIGRQIMEDMARLSLKVVIIDNQKPTSKLR